MSNRRREMLKQAVQGAQKGEPRNTEAGVKNAVLENPSTATDMEVAVRESFQDKIREDNGTVRRCLYASGAGHTRGAGFGRQDTGSTRGVWSSLASHERLK